ncbi:MAG: nitronate monooxygenase [Thermoleophilia bacterium]|nr:nitronate monooxygenase [Thermoleophilia bacterium]
MAGHPKHLEDLIGIEHPVIQAPMAGSTTPELVAAVSEAGGLGSLGSAATPPDSLTEAAAAVRSLTERPFNMNFFCHETPSESELDATGVRARLRPLYLELGLGEPPEPAVPPIAFNEDRLAALLEIAPAVASFHFGLPPDSALAAIRDAGCRVIASATSVSEAAYLSDHGVDAVIAQGAEAGGHRGSFLVGGDDGPVGTFALVPQVVDAVDLPVIAAGGIADGRGLAAALMLGAAGVQIGTAFLSCPEAATHPLHREALRSARSDATTITRAFSGRPARALRNRFTDRAESDPLPFPAQLSISGPLSRTAAERGSPDFLAMWAGQAAPLAREIPAGDLVEKIVAEAEGISGRAWPPMPYGEPEHG